MQSSHGDRRSNDIGDNILCLLQRFRNYYLIFTVSSDTLGNWGREEEVPMHNKCRIGVQMKTSASEYKSTDLAFLLGPGPSWFWVLKEDPSLLIHGIESPEGKPMAKEVLVLISVCEFASIFHLPLKTEQKGIYSWSNHNNTSKPSGPSQANLFLFQLRKAICRWNSERRSSFPEPQS